ncbi:CDGSH iron-sulfur domain-containing protein [Sinimarinibacterium sp. CAU 1509]|uniref:CDGSH iron-sulfur domain-containing protein n=1 Tax=Sinimarinibacterium sp. CAU 1509 TaxID=2562283 RepID=UPI0010AC5BB4|nr:CDGSH iron-sulfur domain-containing protein [Sinimarinibacterium sp. CAU 1509]TJY58369.1 CDGSH iron-sulfur domain-containing protein [Sinimarinibacterium sp. CAU 1509]
MSDSRPCPIIARRSAYVLDLAPGRYLWCACGRSNTQPFCDGSHDGSGMQPMAFEVTRRSGTQWLCGCKHTRHAPHCDGFHNRLPPPEGGG